MRRRGLKNGATALTFSNSHYDPVQASRLYNEYLEEYIMADEWGVDGIMLNEHHNAPFCTHGRRTCSALLEPRRPGEAGNPRRWKSWWPQETCIDMDSKAWCRVLCAVAGRAIGQRGQSGLQP